jgi:hypothetical protein
MLPLATVLFHTMRTSVSWRRPVIMALEFFLFDGIAILFFLPQIKEMREYQKKMQLRLSPPLFSAHDVVILQQIFDEAPYKQIAQTENRAEITFKKYIASLYKKLNEENRRSFLLRYSGYTIIFLPSNDISHIQD